MSMNFATDVVVNDANTLQAKTIKALTAANASTFGVGTNGQVLKSNGTVTYWGDASYSNATTSSAGLMSAEDKTKLDSLTLTTYYEEDIAIATTDWSTSPYTYTWTNANVTSTCYIMVVFKTDPRSVFAGDLNYDKVTGGIQFTATSLPTGTLNVVVTIIDSNTPAIIISQIADQVQVPLVETVSGTTPSITGEPNVQYVCGEVNTISITPPSSGMIDVFFTSGSTAAVLTVPNTVKWPEWFDATSLETNTVYEIMITNGVYGSVATWAA